MPAGVPLPGDFNVANALAAVAACAEVGYEPARVAAGITTGGGVPGRFERIDEGQDFVVVVDYAHKPDAVEAALATLRPLTDGQVIVVIGAGGDRDPGKRPIMGEIAARLADVRGGDRRQPADRGPGRHPAGVALRDRDRAVPTSSRSATAGSPSGRPSAGPGPATSSSSPARATRPARRSTAWCIPSTTGTWSARSWPDR